MMLLFVPGVRWPDGMWFRHVRTVNAEELEGALFGAVFRACSAHLSMCKSASQHAQRISLFEKNMMVHV